MVEDEHDDDDVPATIAGTDWLNVRAACKVLGITYRTLYRLIDIGEVPAYRIGRVIRLRRHEVEAYIEASRVKPGDLAHLYPHVDEADDTASD